MFPFFCVTFNITIFLQDLHVCDPEAALFLSRHHFSVQYAAERGVPYKKFRFDENFLDEENLPALLVHEIMKARKKLLVHNGLWDLLFLYEHFYGPLPSGQQLSSFVADISDMFSGGIIDTKVVAGTEWDEMNLTFLEYLFRKSCHLNAVARTETNAHFCIYNNVYIFDKINQALLKCDNSEKITNTVWRIPYSNAVIQPANKNSKDPLLCREFYQRGFCSRIQLNQDERSCIDPRPKYHNVETLISLENILSKKLNLKLTNRVPPSLKSESISPFALLSAFQSMKPKVELKTCESPTDSNDEGSSLSRDMQHFRNDEPLFSYIPQVTINLEKCNYQGISNAANIVCQKNESSFADVWNRGSWCNAKELSWSFKNKRQKKGKYRKHIRKKYNHLNFGYGNSYFFSDDEDTDRNDRKDNHCLRSEFQPNSYQWQKISSFQLSGEQLSRIPQYHYQSEHKRKNFTNLNRTSQICEENPTRRDKQAVGLQVKEAPSNLGAHSAGYDAYMTGHFFAAFLVLKCSKDTSEKFYVNRDNGNICCTKLKMSSAAENVLLNKIHMAIHPECEDPEKPWCLKFNGGGEWTKYHEENRHNIHASD